jgi:hypothetical protein
MILLLFSKKNNPRPKGIQRGLSYKEYIYYKNIMQI